VVCFHSEISILVHVATAASLAAAATSTDRGGVVSGGRKVGIRLNATLAATVVVATLLIGLLRHLENVTKLLPLVRLHRLLNMSEPLICHFV